MPVINSTKPTKISKQTTSKTVATLILPWSPEIEPVLGLAVSVSDPKGSGFHNVHHACMTRINMPKVCMNEKCDTAGPLDASEIVMAYPNGPFNEEITDEDNSYLETPNKNRMQIHSKISLKEAERLLYFGMKRYDLFNVSNAGAGDYAALLGTLIMNKAAVAVKFCLRSERQNLGVIIPEDGRLILVVIPFHHEIRTAKELDLPTEISASYMKSFQSAFDALPIRPYSEAVDEYEEKLTALIERKIQARIASQPAKTKEKTTVLKLSRKMVVVS